MKINNNWKILIIGFILLILIIILLIQKKSSSKLIKDSIELKVGEITTIDYSKVDDIILWESLDTNIVTVDDSGQIEGISIGKTKVEGINSKNEKKIEYEVSVYLGNKSSNLVNVFIPDGEIIMTENDYYEIPITFVPKDAFIDSINYFVEDKDIVDVEKGKIVSKKVGNTSIKLLINDNIEKDIKINVVDENILSRMGAIVKEVSIENENIKIKKGSSREIIYKVTPSNAYIYRFKMESSNPDIVMVDNKNIIGRKEGSATVLLTVNNFQLSFSVDVINPVKKINIDYYPKKVIKIGEIVNINAKAYPNDTERLVYTSSNPDVLEIVNNDQIVGKKEGSASIEIASTDKSVKETLNFTVYPKTGIINDTNMFWQYKSLNSKIPKRAGKEFFNKLASEGKGFINNNIYSISKDGIKYDYDINNSILSYSGKKAYVRVYYPENTDLSTLNTFNFMGGDGERDFGGYYSKIDQNPSIIQSGGIIILMCDSNRYSNIEYTGKAAINATKFVLAITSQRQGVKNSIGGYSTGGTKIMQSTNDFNYDKYIIFNSYYNWPTSAYGAMNKEVIFYSPYGDHLSSQREVTLSMMTKSNYTNVTIVTNDKNFIDKYSKYYLVVNPGSTMSNGHGFDNITKSGLFAYACD